MLQAGEAQYATVFPPELVPVAEKLPNLEVVRRPSIVGWYVAMNTMKKPFNDPRVRQALNHCGGQGGLLQGGGERLLHPLALAPAGTARLLRAAEALCL